MKLRYKILIGLLVFVGAGVAALGLVLSHDSPCPASPESAAGDTMRAWVYRCYGGPEVLRLETVARPVPTGNEVLVRVKAAAVNPLDWHYLRGTPYPMRLGSGLGAPTDIRVGVDFAGVVEAVGPEVRRFGPGDEVFGGRSGAFAEYVLIPEDRALVAKPPGVSFEQAASVGIAGVTALQALKNKGALRAGQRVLINGASGGVGTFAVQMAKAMGAEVAGVCSTRNVALVESLGADRVYDYKNEDYTESGERYDLVVDMVGNHSPSANRRVLEPGGTLVLVGGPKSDWFAPFKRPLQAMLLSPFVDEQMITLLAVLDAEDLAAIAAMIADGKVTPEIDRRYPLAELPAAIEYSESRRARGKIILTME